MPDGAAVVKYEGKRGTVWRVKYRDADGRQIQETLGRAADGWTKRKAGAELRARLTAVEKEGYRTPRPERFEDFAREWLARYPAAKSLKRSTETSYGQIIEPHLIPALGHVNLDVLGVRRIEEYIATKHRSGYAPRTINRHLNLLNLILSSAQRRGLIRSNPVPLVDRPREPRKRWRILSPAEVGLVERAFEELIAEAEDEKQQWQEQARVIFLVGIGTGLRRGEVQGLRWRSVHLADPDGAFIRVAETWVRYAPAGTPPAALMTRAGHSSFTTTQGYIDLAGETFREEADRLERRLWGDASTRSRYKLDASAKELATGPAPEPMRETA